MKYILAVALGAMFLVQAALAGAFVSWTPTYGSTAGVPGAGYVGTSFAYHNAVDSVEHVQMAFSIDDVGTASGAATATLPSVSLRGATLACVVVNQPRTNCNATVVIGSSVLVIYLDDGTFPVKSNHKEIIVTGFYEIAVP